MEAIIKLRERVRAPRHPLSEASYNEVLMRARVAAIAQHYGDPGLDVGTGACACMAVALAYCGLRVTAVDSASDAVHIAKAEVVTSEVDGRLKVCHANATHLPFSDGTYRVVVAFDVLCHTEDPMAVLSEMFRVCAKGGAVIVTELNAIGREVTRHRNDGFEKKLPDLLAPHCQECQQLSYPHHVIFVCEKL